MDTKSSSAVRARIGLVFVLVSSILVAGPVSLQGAEAAVLPNPNSAPTSLGGQLRVEISAPETDTSVPDGPVTVEGVAGIGGTSSGASVTFVVDVSGSVSGGSNDCNGDGVIDNADNFNPDIDNRNGAILDCEIAGILALNRSLIGSETDVSVVAFGSSAAVADVGPADGVQQFTRPDTDANSNGTPDIEEVLRSLRAGRVGTFSQISIGGGTIFDPALAATSEVLADRRTGSEAFAFFLSDGQGRLSDPSPELAALVADGTKINTYSVGSAGEGCDEGELLRIATETGGECVDVTEATGLVAALTGAPQELDSVNVSVDGGTRIETILNAVGQWSVTLPALTPGAHVIRATAKAADGTEVASEITLNRGDVVEPPPTPRTTPATYFEGTWYGDGYQCPVSVPTPIQTIEIELEGDGFIATKTVGDICVLSGEITFTGGPDGEGWVADTFVGVPGDDAPPSPGPANRPIVIVSANEFKIDGITYRRNLPAPVDPCETTPEPLVGTPPAQTPTEVPNVASPAKLDPVTFGDVRLWGSRKDKARTKVVPIKSVTGSFDIVLDSKDLLHGDPKQKDQPKEQWLLVGLDAEGKVLFETKPTNDLAVEDKTSSQNVGSYDLSGVVAVQGRHAFSGLNGPNSIDPVRASFINNNQTGTRIVDVSPAEGSVVTGPVDIAATIEPAAGTEIASWEVVAHTAASCPEQGVVVASGDGAPAGTLGKFDPTVEPNGAYIVRVQATDTDGGVAVSETAVTVEANFKPGRLPIAFTDASAETGSEIPLQILRSYDTLERRNSSDFGYGWALDTTNFKVSSNVAIGQGVWTSQPCADSTPEELSCYAASSTRFVNVVWPNGQVETFTPLVTKASSESEEVKVSYKADSGTVALEPIAGDDVAYLDSSGRLVTQESGTTVYDPEQFVLKAKDGSKFTLDRDRGLVEAADRAGNTTSYTTAGISSSLGPEISFERDNLGRITSALEPSGATTTYTYDSSGDLVSVIDQNSNETVFTYDNAHLLLTIDDEAPGVGFTMVYDEAGRLSSVTDADDQVTATAVDIDERVTKVSNPDENFTSVTTTDDRGNPLTVDEFYDGESHITKYAFDEDDNLISRVDPEGNTWKATYDSNNNLTSFTNAEGDTNSFTYYSLGQPTSLVDALGQTTRFEYTNGNVSSVTDPRGAKNTFTYDSAGNKLTETDPLGRVSKSTYSAAGLVLSTTDPAGNATSYSYDSQGRLRSMTAPDGGETKYVSDAASNLVSVTDPLGRLTAYTYDSRNQVTSVTDPAGFATKYSYNNAGRITEVLDARGQKWTYGFEFDRLVSESAPDGGVTRYSYDGAARVKTMTDAVGRVVSYDYDDAHRRTASTFAFGDGGTSTVTSTYDGNGRVVASSNGEGEISTVSFDPLGRVTKSVDGLGQETGYTYDAVGNVTAISHPDGEIETFSFDLADQLIAEIDQADAKTSFSYDQAGNLETMTDPLDRVTKFGYDSVNRPISTTLPSGDASAISYDLAGQLVRATSAAGISTSVSYEPRGLPKSATDELGNTALATYNEASQLVSRTDPRGGVIKFERDLVGRVLSETDPLGGKVTFEYDAAGQLTSVTDPNGATRKSSYDDAGNLVSSVDALGRATTMTFDKVNRLTGVTDARGVKTSRAYDDAGLLSTMTSPNESRSFDYDPVGRMVEMKDGSGETNFSYDGVGRLVGATSSAGDVSYNYNLAGERVSMRQPAGTVKYDYDPNGFVSSITDWDDKQIVITNDADGKPLSVVGDNGVESAYGYDQAGRSISIEHSNAAGVIASYEYTLDNNGNRTLVTTPAGNETYSHDALNRLTDVSYPDSKSETFQYDSAGNRTSHKNLDGETTSYVFDAAGQLTSDSGGTTYSYDDSSNLVSASDGQSYDWDDHGRMVAANVGEVAETYTYDALDARVEVDEAAQLWDRVGNLDKLIEDGDNSYLHGPSGVLQAGSSRQLADAIGSIRTVTGADGTVETQHDYTAFGVPRGEMPSTFGFAGEQHDSSGLIHLRARQYQPALGRFLSVDPIQPGAPGTAGWNYYSYSANNPTTWTDPTGQAISIEYTQIATGAVKGGLFALAQTPWTCKQGTDTAWYVPATSTENIDPGCVGKNILLGMVFGGAQSGFAPAAFGSSTSGRVLGQVLTNCYWGALEAASGELIDAVQSPRDPVADFPRYVGSVAFGCAASSALNGVFDSAVHGFTKRGLTRSINEANQLDSLDLNHLAAFNRIQAAFRSNDKVELRLAISTLFRDQAFLRPDSPALSRARMDGRIASNEFAQTQAARSSLSLEDLIDSLVETIEEIGYAPGTPAN